jgi:type II secretory pathway component GspD/PulD (secretin)
MMRFVHRNLITALAALVTAQPAIAQRGAGRGTAPPTRQDTTRRPASTSVALDFQDQELRTVLDAIAAAGQLNVALSNIPSQRITVHMGRPVSRDEMVDMLRQVAESNGLKVTMSPTMIQIVGPPPEPVGRQTPAQLLAQQLAQANQQQQLRLFTYRLKHASAVQLAPVLTNLFSGAATTFRGPGQTVIPNANGNGFTVIGGGNVATPPGNITNITPPFGGRGGGAGRGGGGGNAGNGQVATALQNAIQAASGLSAQSGDIRIIPEETSNSLLIRATESDWALVQQVIQGVDLRPLQVLIEVTIAEVQRTHDLDIGVSGTVARNRGSRADTAFAAPTASARDFILKLTGGNGTIQYDVAIAALQERGDVRVLSLPVIIAQNNRQAVLNVGSSRPFVQVSQTVPNDPTGRVETIQYIDVGTVLTITPTINPDGYVNLQVQQQDNSATNEVQFDAPVINKREATTQIFIRDGQTTVIGGLADNTNSSDISGIPFLSRIPVVGPLIFGRTTKSNATNELFLFLTPHIISSDEDIDRLRNAVKQGSDLLKDVNVGPRINPGGDTINVRLDTLRRDSLSTLRRRPPGDSVPQPMPDSLVTSSVDAAIRKGEFMVSVVAMPINVNRRRFYNDLRPETSDLQS